jgi:hypothetical protein
MEPLIVDNFQLDLLMLKPLLSNMSPTQRRQQSVRTRRARAAVRPEPHNGGKASTGEHDTEAGRLTFCG